MAFADLVNALDAACLATFGMPATFTPQDGSGAQQITGIIQTPAMAEDYVPGSVQGTSVVRLFVRFATSRRRRDTATRSRSTASFTTS